MTAGHVFHRTTATCPPVAVRGEGIYLIGADGRRYIDACGGAAVSCLGHGHPEIGAAIAEQAARLEYIHTGFFTSEPAEELAARITVIDVEMAFDSPTTPRLIIEGALANFRKRRLVKAG